MQLKRYTDYSLRVLIYLGLHPQRVVSVNEIARAYGVSHHHLLKVAAGLAELGVVATHRGKHGGLQLTQPPAAINVGRLVRHVEGASAVIDCRAPHCPILPACTLNRALREAHQAFLETLERYTLADLLASREQALVQLLATGTE